MSVAVARAVSESVLAGERERLLAMVDILEPVPPEEVRALARCSIFTRLDARDAVLGVPEDHRERLLLRLVQSEGLVTPQGYKIPTRYTHQRLATMIGANREAVTRAFGKLRYRGVVELRNRRIFVADLEALKRIARG